MLADLHAAGSRADRFEFAASGSARLEVPEVDGAWAAAHPQNDQALAFPFQFGGILGHGLHEVHARQSERRQAGHVRQEVAAIHFPTEHWKHPQVERNYLGRTRLAYLHPLTVLLSRIIRQAWFPRG